MIQIKSFTTAKGIPNRSGLIFLNGAIGFFIICFPILAVTALLLVTVLESLVAYHLMSLVFKIRIRFRMFIISFAIANVLSTILGFGFFILVDDYFGIELNGDLTLLVFFILCFILSVLAEAFIILNYIPTDLDKLKKNLISIGYERLGKGSNSVALEIGVSVFGANVASYLLLLLIPVVSELISI